MPTLASSNRVQLYYKLEGNYPTNYASPPGGNGTKLRMTGHNLDYSVQSETSKEINSTRQVADLILTGANATGGINFEFSYAEYDPFLLGVLQSSWAYYGTLGKSAALAALTFAAGSITAGAAPTGNDAFTVLTKGQWFKLNPPAGASQAAKDYFRTKVFRVSTTVAPTSTVITLDAATSINTTTVTTAMIAGATLSSAVASNGVVMPSFALEVGYEDIATYTLFKGEIPSKMSLKIEPGAIVTGTIDFLGRDMATGAATMGAGSATASQGYTPINAVQGVFDIFEGKPMASLSTNTYIKSMSFNMDNKLRGQTAVGVFGNAGIAPGQISISGTLEVYFADAVMYTKFINSVDTALHIPLLDPSGNGYVIVLPRLRFGSGKITAGSLDTDCMVSMDYTSLMDTDPTSATYQKSIAIYRLTA